MENDNEAHSAPVKMEALDEVLSESQAAPPSPQLADQFMVPESECGNLDLPPSPPPLPLVSESVEPEIHEELSMEMTPPVHQITNEPPLKKRRNMNQKPNQSIKACKIEIEMVPPVSGTAEIDTHGEEQMEAQQGSAPRNLETNAPSGSDTTGQRETIAQDTPSGYGEMDFVFDSTEDFPIAANPLVVKERKVSAKASRGAEGKKGDKSAKEKGAGQKRGTSANPTSLRVKKRKNLEIPADNAEDETIVEKSPHSSPQPIVNFEETEEERRTRKGKGVEHPVEVVTSFPQTYDFDETELVATLAGNLPQPVPSVGYIWQAGFPPQFSDSVGMHLPGFSKTRDSKKCPKGIDDYSFEMFRANQLPYMVERMKTNPELAIREAASQCFEMGSMLVHIRDDLKKRGGEFFIPEMNHTELARVKMENVWWKNAALSKLRESQRAQNERRSMEHAKSVVEQELSARRMDISSLEEKHKALCEENATLKRVLEASQKREEEMSQEIASLLQRLDEANPEGIAKRFLASRAFANAAMLSCEDVMKYWVYQEFRKLGKLYPFVPEQLGYIELPIEKSRPKSLRGYGWDAHDDLLVGPDGEKLIGTHGIKLRSQAGTGVQYPWPANYFPKDPTIPPRRSQGLRTPRHETNVGGSSHAGSTRTSPVRHSETLPKTGPSGG